MTLKARSSVSASTRKGRRKWSAACKQLCLCRRRRAMRFTRKDGIVFNLGDLTDEVYSMDDPDSGEQFHWNVTVGRRLAEARGDLRTVSLRELGVTVEMLKRQYYGLDEAYALTTNIAK